MWPFSRVRRVASPRVSDLDERLLVVEKSIEWLKKADKELNARISAVMRRTPREDAPGATIETPPAPAVPPHFAFPKDRSRRGF